MSGQARNTGIGVLFLIASSVVTLLSIGISSAQGQQEKERVLSRKTFRNEPLKIFNIRNRFYQTVKTDEPFLASDDWVSGLTFSAENISRKNITYIELELSIFGLKTAQVPDAILPIRFGIDAVTLEKEPTLNLQPSHSAGDLRIDPGHFRRFLPLIQKNHRGNFSVSRAELSTSKVIFDDETMWFHGSIHVRDVNNPRVWMNVDILKRPHLLRQYQELLNKNNKTTFKQDTDKRPNKSSLLTLDSVKEIVKSTLFTKNEPWNTFAPVNTGSNISQQAGACTHFPAATVTDTCSENPPCFINIQIYLEDSCGTRKPHTFSPLARLCTASPDCPVSPTKIFPIYDNCSPPDNDNDDKAGCEDCCDSDSRVYPGAPRNCLGQTNNCGSTDWNCNGTPDQQEPECYGGCPLEWIFWCEIETLGRLDSNCICHWYTPMLIDILGNGYSLTNAVEGVSFDLIPGGSAERTSWTAANSDDAFVVLDRNGNGTIDNGSELFGDETPQPQSPMVVRNGFLALAEFDKPSNGGNQDGVIDARDMIFNSLRLWQDMNHNGISEILERHSFQQFGLEAIDLKYKPSARIDSYGNRFRYKSKVRSSQGTPVGKWAWDVSFVVTQ
jgi:hypothetical protein